MKLINKLFFLEDHLLQLRGLYLMWTCLYIGNIVSLAVDDTQDASRDFNIWSNGMSVIYCGIANANIIYGNGKPSSFMLISGPVHQYLYWLLFTYFGSNEVLGSHPIGVMNWINTILVGIFSIDMVIKTWILTLKPSLYLDYLKSQ